jgi:Tfp pilus assembly protein PilO
VKNRRPLVVGLAFVGLALVVLVALVMPKHAAVQSHQKKLDEALQQGQQLEVEVAALNQAKDDAPETKRQLKAIGEQIPSTASLPDMLRLIRRAADGAAVDFIQISPGTPTLSTDGAFSTIPTSISTTGSYFSLEEFLYRLETLNRSVKVTNLTLGAGPAGLPQLSAQLTANLFTTDTSAGPGSQPGPSDVTAGA